MNKKPAVPPEPPTGDLQQALHDLHVHQVELEQQNVELRRAQLELEASRARYASLYDEAPIGLLTLNNAGLILEANLAAAALLNTPRNALLRTPLGRFVFGEDSDNYYLLCRKIFQTRQPQTCELRITPDKGRPFWAFLKAATDPFVGDSVPPVLNLVLSDNPERKRAEEALLESSHYTRTLLETSVDPFVIINAEGIITDVNIATETMTGVRRDRLIGHEFSAFLTDPSKARAGYRETFERGQITDFPLAIRHTSGTATEVQLNASVYQSKSGRTLGIFAAARDVTGLKQAERALAQERERLAGILRGTHVGTWEWNVQTGETVFNERWAEILGYTLAELAPVSIDTWMRLAHPDDLARSGALLERHFRGELDYYEFESRMKHKLGHWVWVLDRGSVSRWTADGKPGLMLGTHQEITERKQTELKLESVSVIQQTLMNLATHLINVPLDQQDAAIERSLMTMGKLIQADRAYLFRYDTDRGTMSNTHEWCAGGIAPEIANLQDIPLSAMPVWVAAHQRGETIHIPSVAALPAADPVRPVLEAQCIRSLITLPLMQGSACLGFVGFDAVREDRLWRKEEEALLHVLAELFSNFEARRGSDRQTRQLQTDLTQARDTAQAAALSKSLFLANMSHEIRTPLNAILGYAQIMERECHACPTKHRLSTITRSGDHLLALITDLLELVRSDARMITLAPVEFDFHQLLADVRLMFVRRPEAQALTLTIAPPSAGVPRCLLADSGKIRQILANLLDNAIKFTKTGGVTLTASVVAGGGPDNITLAVDVDDTGSGIPENEREHLFEVYTQTASGRKSGTGTGLGLPLSRRYARALGGDIILTSRPGPGCLFRFTFNARPAAGGAAAHPLRGPVRRLAPRPRPLHILTVDDDPMSRDLLTALLEPVGFSVEPTALASHALRRLREPDSGIDLVLIDKHMPHMDGYEAIAWIRRLPNGRDLPVLIITASGFADEKENARAAGANGYVSKPVRREALLEEIARVTGVHYEYEPAPDPAGPKDLPAALTAGALAQLPAAMRQDLALALRRGDIRQLRSLVEAIARDQAGLAAALRLSLDAYDYARLSRLLEESKGTAP